MKQSQKIQIFNKLSEVDIFFSHEFFSKEIVLKFKMSPIPFEEKHTISINNKLTNLYPNDPYTDCSGINFELLSGYCIIKSQKITLANNAFQSDSDVFTLDQNISSGLDMLFSQVKHSVNVGHSVETNNDIDLDVYTYGEYAHSTPIIFPYGGNFNNNPAYCEQLYVVLGSTLDNYVLYRKSSREILYYSNESIYEHKPSSNDFLDHYILNGKLEFHTMYSNTKMNFANQLILQQYKSCQLIDSNENNEISILFQKSNIR